MNGSTGQLMALPSGGIPLSFEQIEEHSINRNGTLSVVDVVQRSKTYRDSSGRLRIEPMIGENSDQSPANNVHLMDPIVGSRVFLSSAEKVAYRFPSTVSGQAKFAFFDIPDVPGSPHEWIVRTEDAGKRTIEGIEFNGTRLIQIAEDNPLLTDTRERWFSDKLKLLGLASVSGPQGGYTATIQNVQYGEPDPALFAIPPDYKVVDVQLPLPEKE
jgi:hypothetical protein